MAVASGSRLIELNHSSSEVTPKTLRLMCEARCGVRTPAPVRYSTAPISTTPIALR